MITQPDIDVKKTAAVPRSGSVSPKLKRLLDGARASSPAERLPKYRDMIAGHGLDAVEPLTAWLGEPVFAAFAIRTLERATVLVPDCKTAVCDALVAVDRTGLPEYLARDLDEALGRLGITLRRRTARRATAPAKTGSGDEYIATGKAPLAHGPCGIPNADGSECQNPGRWPISGVWSCTTHYKAHTRRGGTI